MRKTISVGLMLAAALLADVRAAETEETSEARLTENVLEVIGSMSIQHAKGLEEGTLRSLVILTLGMKDEDTPQAIEELLAAVKRYLASKSD